MSTDVPRPSKPPDAPKPLLVGWKQLAEALVKQLGIHEGIWGVYLEFGIQGVNLPIVEPEGAIVPAAIIPVLRMGLQAFDKETSLSVDASKVNPAPPPDAPINTPLP